MQVTELTIGSLVKTNKGDIIRVESISTKRQHRKLGYHEPNDPCHIKYVRLGQVEPIPLTSEILEKNGFIYKNGGFYNPELFGDRSYIIEGIKGWCISFEHPVNLLQIRINFVHQLQAAVRLCGLKDLADNFKI